MAEPGDLAWGDYQSVRSVSGAAGAHPAHWRLLRVAVAEGPDDQFVVGDTHQRIYDRRASLGSLSINIVERSHRLKINDRTTYEVARHPQPFVPSPPE